MAFLWTYSLKPLSINIFSEIKTAEKSCHVLFHLLLSPSFFQRIVTGSHKLNSTWACSSWPFWSLRSVANVNKTGQQTQADLEKMERREVLVFADHNPASVPATPHCFSPDRQLSSMPPSKNGSKAKLRCKHCWRRWSGFICGTVSPQAPQRAGC